jgi:hypothetical protein
MGPLPRDEQRGAAQSLREERLLTHERAKLFRAAVPRQRAGQRPKSNSVAAGQDQDVRGIRGVPRAFRDAAQIRDFRRHEDALPSVKRARGLEGYGVRISPAPPFLIAILRAREKRNQESSGRV